MGKTVVSVREENFYINGKLTYSEIQGSKPQAHGLLMNARFIQGIFDDKSDKSRFNRFGRSFDPEKNTDDLIAALPEWYKYGLRAFTVGFQGGGPCFTIANNTINNNPFTLDGESLDSGYASRMDRLIRAADKQGLVVIVSYFYGEQAKRLESGQSILNATRTASRFLKEGKYSNVIIEVANEHNIEAFNKHTILYSAEGIVALIEIARQESGGMLVGCSGGGGYAHKEICQASDVILIHGNGCSRQDYYKLIETCREWAPNKPVLCNEDSQAIGQLQVAFKTHSSWGYYNNMTKQEPPVDWTITTGEDRFFVYRMADGIGIKLPSIPDEEQYYLQGFEPKMKYEGKQWIRVASLNPETIDYVEFYRNGKLLYTSFDEPFSLYFVNNWLQKPWIIQTDDREWKAVIYLRNGEILEKSIDIR